MSFAQVGNGPCNQMNALVSPTYVTSVSSSTNWLGSSQWSNRNILTDSNLSNYASWSSINLGSAWIEARQDSGTNFPAGSYAGFVVGDLDLLTLGASMRVSTYLNGVVQEEVSYSTLLGHLLDGGKRKIGFQTTKPFNRIRLTVNAGLTFIFSAQAYYAEVMRVCTSPELECNTPTNVQNPLFAAVVNPTRTGTSGINIGSVTNQQNVLDTNNSNFASLTNFASILGSSYLSVKDNSKTYPAGTYAGYEIENAILFGMNALNTVAIKTYLNGTLQEQKSGTSLFLDVPILDASNRRIFGFETSKAFDEVQIVVSQPFGINLGTTKVYNMVVSKPCEGPELACNTQTIVSRPTYPLNINSVNTGVTGIATTLSVVEDPDKAIDNDPNSYAKITLPITGGTVGSLAIKKSLSDYAAGTYVAFDIQNQSIFNAQFIQNTTITTYRDGVQQESATGNGLFLRMGSDLIASSGRSTLGFVTTKAFDEARISINSIVAANWGTTRVYGLMVMKPCAKQIDCNDSYYWNQPDFPVVLNADRTGISSILCLGCSVNNPGNLIDNNPDTYSRITVAAGIGNTGSVSVVDPSATYPKGTFIGFTVKDRYFFVQGDLLEFISIKTYNNGVLQETSTSADLFDLTLLIPIWGTGTRNVGFYTTKEFDEIQIVAHSVGSVVNVLDVYGAFVDTRSSDGGSLSCASELIANSDSFTISVGNVSNQSVLANDTIDGQPATLSNVSLSQVSSTNSGVSLDPSTGLIYVEPGTQPGNYQFVYQICDKENPTNCETATVNVTVIQSDIEANDDALTGPISPNGGTTTGSVLDNGDNPVFAGIAPGTYKIEVENGCGETRNVTVSADAVQIPKITPSNLCEGENGTLNLPELSFMNVTWTRNGGPLPADVTLTNNGYTLNFSPYNKANHIGNYVATLTYKTPNSCAPVVVSYNLTATNDINPEAGTSEIVYVDPTTLTTPIDLFNYIDGYYDTGGTWSETTNPASGLLIGNYFNAVSLSTGTYMFQYSVDGTCSGNDTTIVTVVLSSLELQPDMGTAIAGQNSTAVENVLENDTFNGVINPSIGTYPGQIQLSTISADNPGITLDPVTGAVVVSDVVLPGVYVLEYQACVVGSDPQICKTETVTITVDENVSFISLLDINQTPVNQLVAGNVLNNDESSNGIAIIESATYFDAAGTNQNLPLGTPTNVYTEDGVLAGSMTLNTDGSYTFTPATDFVGEVPIQYTANNGAGLTDSSYLSIEVIQSFDTMLNNSPIAHNDQGLTVQGTTLESTLLGNDSDADGDVLTITSAELNGNPISIGTGVVVDGIDLDGNPVSNAGTLTINSVGTYVFVPNPTFVGEISPIQYTISDGNGGTNQAILVINVIENDAEYTFANDDANFGPNGQPISGNILDNDFDPNGYDQTITLIDFEGTSIVPGVLTTLPGIGTIVFNTDGTYTFTPNVGYVGTEIFTYTICNTANPIMCDNAQLILTSLDIESNHLFAVEDINQTPIGTQVSGNVLTNDESVTSLTVQSATYLDAAGVIQNLPLGTSTTIYSEDGIAAGNITLNSIGTYTFIPTATFVGDVPVNYIALNAAGFTDNSSLEIKVIDLVSNQDNNEPIAHNDVVFTEYATSVTSNLFNNDSDPDGDTFVVTSVVQNGVSLGAGSIVSGINEDGTTVANAGTITINSDGTYTFVPSANFSGTINPITYTISDGNGGTDTAELYITVMNSLLSSGNNVFAFDDANTAPKGQTMQGNVLANDTDPKGDDLEVISATVNGINVSINGITNIPGVGTISLLENGIYEFIPLPTYEGTIVVEYSMCDDNSNVTCCSASLYITSLKIESACYLPDNFDDTGLTTNVGISSLRSDNSGNWPMVREGGWIALESKTKGFVPNRMTNEQIAAIPVVDLVVGMMVYNVDGTAEGWNCFKTPACPN